MTIRTDFPMGIGTFQLNGWVAPFFSAEVKTKVHMSKFPDTLKRQILMNLNRGYGSSTGGVQANVYTMIADIYKIPVFMFGRGSTMIFCTPQDKKTRALENLKTMHNLAYAAEYPSAIGTPYFWVSTRRNSPKHGLLEIRCTRPANFNLAGLLTAMDLKSIWDLVPRENTLQARAAVERGMTVEYDFQLQGTNQ